MPLPWLSTLKTDLPDLANKNTEYLVTTSFPGGASGKESTCQSRRHKNRAQSLGGEDPLEGEMATHSGILAQKILWTEELGGIQSMG